MTEVSIVGVDLAKQAFQLHAAARDGTVVFRRKLSRSRFVEVMAKLPRCVVAMEACATAGAGSSARKGMRCGSFLRST